MKKATLLFLAFAASANAAITISGTAILNAKVSDNTTSIPAGTLGLLVLDQGTAGFFGKGNQSNGTLYTSVSDPSVDTALAGLSVGSTFGGERVLARLSAPGAGAFSNLFTGSIAGFENGSFAVIWFDGLLASGSQTVAPVGTKWGTVRGADWTFPAADAGTFTMSSSDANGAGSYYQVNTVTPAVGADNFRTTNTAFTVAGVPEPSGALLGAIGALVLLRRRRN